MGVGDSEREKKTVSNENGPSLWDFAKTILEMYSLDKFSGPCQRALVVWLRDNNEDEMEDPNAPLLPKPEFRLNERVGIPDKEETEEIIGVQRSIRGGETMGEYRSRPIMKNTRWLNEEGNDATDDERLEGHPITLSVDYEGQDAPVTFSVYRQQKDGMYERIAVDLRGEKKPGTITYTTEWSYEHSGEDGQEGDRSAGTVQLYFRAYRGDISEGESIQKTFALSVPEFHSLAWLKDGGEVEGALVGDEVIMSCEVKCIGEGETVKFKIFEQGKDEAIKELEGEVKDDRVESSWTVVYKGDGSNSTKEEIEKNGWAVPDYYFVAEYCGVESDESKRLKTKNWICKKLTDAKTNNSKLAKMNYSLILPDGTELQGITDTEGFTKKHILDAPSRNGGDKKMKHEIYVTADIRSRDGMDSRPYMKHVIFAVIDMCKEGWRTADLPMNPEQWSGWVFGGNGKATAEAGATLWGLAELVTGDGTKWTRIDGYRGDPRKMRVAQKVDYKRLTREIPAKIWIVKGFEHMHTLVSVEEHIKKAMKILNPQQVPVLFRYSIEEIQRYTTKGTDLLEIRLGLEEHDLEDMRHNLDYYDKKEKGVMCGTDGTRKEVDLFDDSGETFVQIYTKEIMDRKGNPGSVYGFGFYKMTTAVLQSGLLDTTLAHEICHNLSLGHRRGDTNNLMSDNGDTRVNDYLEYSQVLKIKTYLAGYPHKFDREYFRERYDI